MAPSHVPWSTEPRVKDAYNQLITSYTQKHLHGGYSKPDIGFLSVQDNVNGRPSLPCRRPSWPAPTRRGLHHQWPHWPRAQRSVSSLE